MPITSVRLARSWTVSPRRNRHSGLAGEGAAVSGGSTEPCCPTGTAPRERDRKHGRDRRREHDGDRDAQDERPAVEDDRDRGAEARDPEHGGGEQRWDDGRGGTTDAMRAE